MRGSIVSFFLLFLLCFCIGVAYDSGRQMCIEAENLVARHCDVERAPTGLQRIVGPPGKSGQKGDKGGIGPSGPSGMPGSNGEVDYAVLNATIHNIFGPVIERMRSKIDKLTEELEEMSTRFNESLHRSEAHESKALCNMMYDGKCFFAIHYPEQNITYGIAARLCRSEGGIPANIYSRSHYDFIMEHLRESRRGTLRHHLWLGMRINPSTGAVSLYNGNPATFTQWHPGFPSSVAENKVLELAIDSPEVTRQGMFNNQNPSQKLHGVLCEK